MAVTSARTLYLVTARAGSKGVPNKNIRQIGGLSLVGWKARAARQCDPGCRLVISTDSEEIAIEAKQHGVDVPFLRPAELATDTASSASVIKHALETLLANGETFDQVMLLEPASPFCRATDMRKALLTMEAFDADLVVGMKLVEPHPAFVGERRTGDSVSNIIVQMKRHGRNLRRQDFGDSWTFSGSLYLFNVPMFLRHEDIYAGVINKGILIDHHHAIEIDSPTDLELAEHYFAKGYVELPT